MLSTLSRMFQSGPPSETDRQTEKDVERDADSGLGLVNVPLQRKPSTNLSIAMNSVRTSGPSHIEWKSPSTQHSPASSAFGVHPLNRTASSPSLTLTQTCATTNTPNSCARPPSAQSLRVDLLRHSVEDPDRVSLVSLHDATRSAPKLELLHVPPTRRPSMESVPRTPDSTRVLDGHGQPASLVHQAFLRRTLKRSVSQTSTSTLQSSMSVAPPTIPPLDLRPDFQSSLGLPAPRKSRLAPPSLPTVVGSPTRPAKYSVIYEDNDSIRTGSFITAPSVSTEPEETAADSEHPSGPAVYVRDYAYIQPHLNSTTNATSELVETDITESSETRVALPLERFYDVDLNGESNHLAESVHSDTSQTSQDPLHRSRSPTPFSESHIHQRWLKDVMFGPDRPVIPLVQQRTWWVSPACALFWLGFLGPWCWLIGGWVLTSGGEIRPDAPQGDAVLPMWTRKGKKRPGAPGTPRGKAASRKGIKSWYPLVAPSADTLSPSVHSRTSLVSARRLSRVNHGTLDPWVRRCRIAAITSGVVLLAACVVALVVAGSTGT
ncbi:hypothetical protein OBBRIDRAFT_722427 [Obba rivulosa]|uniref:Uncharacterized protein n=1 Tax=Obba rivulosa TaxID=1052685 RepID=A0A8E2J4R7_9APHY|nr:hypothetical protein OBBRIDRAFT_722427 [Obba rivulosa]